MKGEIVHYTVEASEGIVVGEDGKRYSFSRASFLTPQSPRAGASVAWGLSALACKFAL